MSDKTLSERWQEVQLTADMAGVDFVGVFESGPKSGDFVAYCEDRQTGNIALRANGKTAEEAVDALGVKLTLLKGDIRG